MNIPTLSPEQYQLVVNVLNLSVALLGASALLMVLLRERVSLAYRLSLSLMAAATAMACYHYLRLLESWRGAFVLRDNEFRPSGLPYGDAFRYADWMGTVPLILAALMLVLDIGRQRSSSLVGRLVTAAYAMLLLGYVGELAQGSARVIWGVLSTLPFVYIAFVLWGEVAAVLRFESAAVRDRFSQLRWLLLVSWSLQPVAYAIPLLGNSSVNAFLSAQFVHSVGDILAKAVFSLLLYALAYEKTLDTPMVRVETAPESLFMPGD